ncbi:hypothetical protein PR001_g28382 [Phytophthora rubi]|uniref:Uncharacterized protein n=1 Tax=Phytophthora rubi TaxID=129364 RepID=A0A6A3HBF8_9STRA|nr:hypothetical protein PR001_g28382 [Phytophthora rubi]
MHPFCGKPVGQEGYGQHILCPDCDTGKEPRVAAPPIVEAMARQGSRNESIISSDDADLEEDQDRDDVTTSSSTNAVDVIQRPSRSSSRSAQHVSTIQQRRRVVLWMLQFEKREGNKNMFARAVDEFPDVFNSATRNANLNKAIAWWKKRDQLAQPSRGSVGLSGLRDTGRKRVNRKALTGRGRRRSPWVNWIYPKLLSEFDRLRKLGLKFDSSLLRQVALRL